MLSKILGFLSLSGLVGITLTAIFGGLALTLAWLAAICCLLLPLVVLAVPFGLLAFRGELKEKFKRATE